MDASVKTELGSADILKIMELLPHRYPFLMVDRIYDMRGDEGCVGVKNVTVNEPQFQGHFPRQPIMPGVLMIEGMAQTAGALCIAARQAGSRAQAVYLMTVDEAKFRRPVGPGDVIEYHMTKLKNRRNMWWYRGEAKVRGELVAEGVIGAMLVEN